MVEARFFDRLPGLTVAEIASLTGAEPRDGANLSLLITNIAPIDQAGPADLTFLDGTKFAKALASTQAGAVLTTERFERQAPSTLTVLRARKPYDAFITVARQIYAGALRPTSPMETTNVAPGSVVDPSARLADGVTVDPGAVIGPLAEIGARTSIGANAVIGARVRIGSDCTIGANGTITHSQIGDRVIIHPGCHIGQDGFGYIGGAQGHIKVPHIGSVVIHSDVEIGAGTAIDRGGMRDTVIGEGTKIDNLVHIGHNAIIGRHCIIAGQSGLSGSVTLEDFVMLGGVVGIAPHVTIGRGARLAARAGVISNVPAGESWGGYPARPMARWMRETATLGRLAARSPAANPATGEDDAETDQPPTAT